MTQPQKAQVANDKAVEHASLAEKYEMPVEAVKGICDIFEKIRNGMSDADAMEAIKTLSDEDFESEVSPA